MSITIIMQTPSASSFNIREDNRQSSSSHDDDTLSGSVDPAHDCSLPNDTIQEDNCQSSSSHDDDTMSGSLDKAHDCSLPSDIIQEDSCQSSSSHDDDSVPGSVDLVHDCSLLSDTIQEENCQSSSSHDDDSVSGSVDPVHDCSLPSNTITPHLTTTSICHSQSVSGGMHILDEEAQSTYAQSSHAFRSAQSLQSCGLSQSFNEEMQFLQTYNVPAQSPSTNSALEFISPRSLLVCTRSQSIASGVVISQPLLSCNSLQPLEAPITQLWDDDTDSDVVSSPQPEMLLDVTKSASLPLPCIDVSVQLHSQSQLVIAHPFSPADNAGITGCHTTGEVKSYLFKVCRTET